MAPASDFPYGVNCISTNFRDKNEMMMGSGQYLFWFRVTRTEFDYSLSCIKYMRMRAPLRSLNWRWSEEKEAEVIIGDSEEGVSIYVYDEKLNNIKLRGFDIGLK